MYRDLEEAVFRDVQGMASEREQSLIDERQSNMDFARAELKRIFGRGVYITTPNDLGDKIYVDVFYVPELNGYITVDTDPDAPEIYSNAGADLTRRALFYNKDTRYALRRPADFRVYFEGR